MYVSKSDFLQALAIEEEDLTVPGLGVVRIKPLSLADRAAIQKTNTSKDGQIDVLAMQTSALLAGLVEPRISGDDVALLQAGRPAILDAIVLRIMEASGMEPTEAFEKKVGSGS